MANPATVKGAIAVAAGLAVLVFPGLSVDLVLWSVGLAVIASGGYDLWFAISGRTAHGGSRWLALGRGVLGLGMGLVVVLAPWDGLGVLTRLLGVYLLLSGVLSLLAALLGRDRARRPARLTRGGAALAFGVLALVVPDAVIRGMIVSAAVLGLVVGGMLVAYGLRAGGGGRTSDLGTASVGEILWTWVRDNDIGEHRRAEIGDSLYFEQPNRHAKLVAWWVMLLLSVAIATFAILQDSTAVVIGAMLIAPLMTPMLGLAGSIVNGWRRRAVRSAVLVGLGVLAAVGLAYVISAWLPGLIPFDANAQITSRVNPTLVDMLIALAAGAAGAVATVNSRVAASIAGVAIAVALVPPLGVVGISLENGRWEDASGAMLLFATNFVSIVLAAAAVFVMTGFSEGVQLRANQRGVLSTLAPFGAIALVILVPLVFTTEGILASASQQNAAQDVVADWAKSSPELRVEQVAVDGSTVTVSVSGAADIPDPAALQRSLSEGLSVPVEVSLEYMPSMLVSVSQQGVVQSDPASPGAAGR